MKFHLPFIFLLNRVYTYDYITEDKVIYKYRRKRKSLQNQNKITLKKKQWNFVQISLLFNIYNL